MADYAAIQNMQQAIMNYVKANMPKDENKAKFGRIYGNNVIIENKSYSYVSTVDLYFGDGDNVACIIPDSGNVAAIVGVL